MEFINNLFGIPLGYVMWPIYQLVRNYGVAIILFTLVTKVLLFPLAVKQQKSMASTQAIQPKLQALQKKYANNKEKLQEEQMKLYSEEGVNPMGSCLPLLIQMPILFGIIDVVYRPMTHIMHFSDEVITKASDIAKTVFEAAGELPKYFSGYQEQIYIMQAYAQNPEKFSSIPNFADKVGDFSMTMFGGAIDLGATPTWTWPILLIPILAGLSQMVMSVYSQWYQKKNNPAMQSMGAMNAIMYVMPVVSVMMAFSLPAGAGFYWIMQSLFSLAQSILLNKIYTPEKVALLLQNESAKKKKKGPSYMQKVMQQQQEAMKAANGGKVPTNATVVSEASEEPEVKLSKTAQKDMSSKVIAEARRRYAEKYGDDTSED